MRPSVKDVEGEGEEVEKRQIFSQSGQINKLELRVVGSPDYARIPQRGVCS